MVEESNESSGGGGLKYGIIGLLLIGGAVAIWFAMNSGGGEQAKKQPPPEPEDAGAQRSTSLAEPEIVIPDEDAGHDAGEEEVVVKKKVVYVDQRCNGTIPAQEAMAVVNRHRRQVRNCYERRLKVNNTLQGKVRMQLTIGRDGSVTGVQVGGSLGDPQVFSCIRSLAKRWTFPQPEGGCATIAAPFDFTPKR